MNRVRGPPLCDEYLMKQRGIIFCAVLCKLYSVMSFEVQDLNTNTFNLRINTDTVDSDFPLNIKVKVKVKFTLEQATKAQRGSRGIALLFL